MPAGHRTKYGGSRGGWIGAGDWLGLTLCLAAVAANGLSVGAAETSLTARFVVRHWTTDTGLPQNGVQSLLQTRDGYLWIGTRRGLARFDGLKFRIFDRDNTQALEPSDSCTVLAEDPAGTLWIGTANGLVRLREGKFDHFNIDPVLWANRVWVLSPSQDGSVWVGSSAGLRRWQNGSVSLIEEYPAYVRGGANNITGLIEDQNGTLWVGDHWQFAGRQAGAATFEKLVDAGVGHASHGANYLCRDDTGAFWYGNERGVFRWRGGTLTNLLPGPLSAVSALTPRRDGGVWVYARSQGFGFIGDEGITWLGKPDDFPAVDIQVIHEDREGNVWLGSGSHGLIRLQPRRLLNYTTADGLASDAVWSLSAGPDGSVWAATNEGLCQFDGQRWETLPVLKPDGSFNEFANGFRVVFAGQAGVVWAASEFLRCYQQARFEFPPFRHPRNTNEIPSGLQTIYQAKDGSLWFAVREGALHWDGTRTEFLTTTNGLSHASVVGILEDAEGGLWFGGGWEQGMAENAGWVDRRLNGRFTAYGAADGLPKDKVGPLLAEPDGRVWFGSGSGLLCWKEGRFHRITTQDGLAEDVVGGLLADDQGWFWFFGHHGIHRVRQQELHDLADGRRQRITCITYGEADGMASAEGNAGVLPSCCRTRDGRLWFPTTRGVVVADPHALVENEQPPPVVIERIVANQEVLSDTGIAATSANPPPDWKLAPGRGRVLAVRYTAPTFTAPERVRFRHQLEGQDEHWNEPAPDADRVAYYTNLRPGRYRFRVSAASRGGEWGAPAEFAFTLAPYFYETWPFYLLCTAAVLALGAGLHFARITGLRRIEQLERLHALDQQRSRIARDLHDDLGADLSRVAILSERLRLEPLPPEATRRQLETIATASRDMVENIRELVWAADPRNDRFANLAAYLREYAAGLLEDAGLRAHLDFAEEAVPGSLTSEFRRNVFLAVKEALGNILKHAAATEVEVRLRVRGRQLEIRVTDNGRGFEPAKVGQFSSGLRNLRQRLANVGGSVQVTSEVGRGTTVELRAPLPVPDA